MKLSTLLTTTLVSTGAVIGAIATPAFAAPEGCQASVTSAFGASYCIDDSGSYFGGNDKGNARSLNATYSNFDSVLDADWNYKGDDTGSLVSVSGLGSTSGTVSFDFSGTIGVGVKAGNAHLLYIIEDYIAGTSLDWSTSGIVNGGGNTPGLSHMSLYSSGITGGNPTEEVPEPLTMMGSAVALGFGGYFQKKRNAKKSAK